MQTIIGANGSIGNILAKELLKYTDKIRLVSRNPKIINKNDELVKADATKKSEISNAVKGSDIVYLTIGLPYLSKVWKEKWLPIMENVTEACEKHNSKLVFFDNVYMYGKVDGKMTEETPLNPCSRKGEVRAVIAEKLMNEIKSGSIKGLIARSADFYGKSPMSPAYFLVAEKLKNGKKAQWLANANTIHSMTYIPDAAKATALLGNTGDAYGEIWHLPTDSYPLTGKEFMQMTADAMNVKLKYSVLKPWLLKTIGLFNPVLNEISEMLYQNKYDYIFDSSKFDERFDFNKTTYKQGINEMVK